MIMELRCPGTFFNAKPAASANLRMDRRKAWLDKKDWLVYIPFYVKCKNGLEAGSGGYWKYKTFAGLTRSMTPSLPLLGRCVQRRSKERRCPCCDEVAFWSICCRHWQRDTAARAVRLGPLGRRVAGRMPAWPSGRRGATLLLT